MEHFGGLNKSYRSVIFVVLRPNAKELFKSMQSWLEMQKVS